MPEEKIRPSSGEDLPDTSYYKSFSGDIKFYKNSDNIFISISDLKLELIRFKDAVKKEIYLPLVIPLLSLLIPVFTSEFKPFLIFSKDTMRIIYIIFVIISMFLLIVPILKSLWISLIKILNKINKSSFSELMEKYEPDPYTKADLIARKCFKKNN